MARNARAVLRQSKLALNNNFKYKLVLLGESGVGKSALVVRFAKEQFYEHIQPTIGAAFMTQTIQVDDAAVTFEIWDTAGQELYRSILPLYYRGAQAAVAVYDIQKQDSFLLAQTWVKEMRRQCSPNIVIALAGNKADMADNRAVDYEEVKKYADTNGLIFMETSAKTAVNVNEIFLALARKLPRNNPTGSQRGNIRPSASESPRQSSNCCKGNRRIQQQRNYDD